MYKKDENNEFREWMYAWDRKTFTNDIRILKLHDAKNNTIAHEQAEKGWTTNEYEILKITDNWKFSVARIQAQFKWTTEDLKLLVIEDNNRKSLALYQIEKGWKVPKHLQKFEIKGITLQKMYKIHTKNKI